MSAKWEQNGELIDGTDVSRNIYRWTGNMTVSKINIVLNNRVDVEFCRGYSISFKHSSLWMLGNIFLTSKELRGVSGIF